MTFASTIGQVIASFKVPVTRLRRTGQAVVVNGRAQQGPTEATIEQYGTHPSKGDAAEMLPEGMRSKAKRWFFTQTPLNTYVDPGIEGDVVIYHGEQYQIWASEPWNEGGFFRCMGVKVAQPTAAGLVRFAAVNTPGTIDAAFVKSLVGLLPQAKVAAFIQANAAGSTSLYIAIPEHLGTPSFAGATMTLVAFNVAVDGVNYAVWKSPTGAGALLVTVT